MISRWLLSWYWPRPAWISSRGRRRFRRHEQRPFPLQAVDVMSIAVVVGEITAREGLDLLLKMVDEGRSLRAATDGSRPRSLTVPTS
jgi:hypothetical protein